MVFTHACIIEGTFDITNYSSKLGKLPNAHKHIMAINCSKIKCMVIQVVVKANVLKGTETFFLSNLKVLCMPPWKRHTMESMFT